MRFMAMALFASLLACGAEAKPQTHDSFLPENDLYLQDVGPTAFLATGMTEAIFNQTIQTFQKAYAPIIARKGVSLQIRGDWNDPTVNAYASQQGSIWLVQMFGGMARRPEVTIDGFAMVIGHELGHHLGGFPTYPGDSMASEGQSDYFATHSAAKLAWGAWTPVPAPQPQPQPSPICPVVGFTKSYSDTIVRKCNLVYSGAGEQNLCYRSLEAGLSLSTLLANLNMDGPVNIDTPDRTVVTRTNTSYPRTSQSRLDSMTNGALCAVRWNDDVIPKTEAQSVYYLCSSLKSAYGRPRSWFAPTM